MNEYFNALKCGKPQDLAGRAAYAEKKFSSLGRDCESAPGIAFCYQSSVDACLWTAFLWHFGFRSGLAPMKALKKGVELAQKYFAVVAKELTKATKETPWFLPYSSALLLATLSGCKKERAQLSGHLHPGLVVEDWAIPLEPALGDFLLCAASTLQTSPMDVTKIETRLRSSRKKRPKLLVKAWDALQSDDRDGFHSAIEASTKEFAKSAEDILPIDAIADLESILIGLAGERGWSDLTFDLPVAARLITRSSLELE